MSIINEIILSYRRPQQVFDNFLDQEFGESHALGFLSAGCGIAFISHWPTLARQSHVMDESLDMMLGGALFGWIFLAPLLFYMLAALLALFLAVLGLRIHFLFVRLTLFWSFLATGPIMLMYGLANGFLGQGNASNFLGFLWVAFFFWFLFCGYKTIRQAVR